MVYEFGVGFLAFNGWIDEDEHKIHGCLTVAAVEGGLDIIFHHVTEGLEGVAAVADFKMWLGIVGTGVGDEFGKLGFGIGVGFADLDKVLVGSGNVV
ncbi:hypothetical protein HYO62_09545 [Aerococcaceae bacterium DSM 111022]|nr:hypothetical protein [Aerococcaceae bacterium DSM 111022]